MSLFFHACKKIVWKVGFWMSEHDSKRIACHRFSPWKTVIHFGLKTRPRPVGSAKCQNCNTTWIIIILDLWVRNLRVVANNESCMVGFFLCFFGKQPNFALWQELQKHWVINSTGIQTPFNQPLKIDFTWVYGFDESRICVSIDVAFARWLLFFFCLLLGGGCGLWRIFGEVVGFIVSSEMLMPTIMWNDACCCTVLLFFFLVFTHSTI